MTRTLACSPEPRRSSGEAIEWYEARRPGLGAELLELARETFERIQEAPHQLPGGVEGREYGRFVLDRFPYLIIFAYDDDEVRIVAFADA